MKTQTPNTMRQLTYAMSVVEDELWHEHRHEVVSVRLRK